ncbi:MAG: LTA synthase family protein [Bacteroidales bacterium]
MNSIFSLKNRNVYVMTFWRLSLVFFLFSVTRILFYVFNKSYFSGMTTWHLFELMVSGLKFDLTAVLYTNLLFLLMMIVPFRFRYNMYYQRVAKYIYVLFNSVAMFLNMGDIVYFRNTLRRTDFSVFTEFGNDHNSSKIVFTAMIQNWYLTVILVLLIVVLIKGYGKMKPTNAIATGWKYYLTGTVLLALSMWHTVCGIRGGYGMTTRPITISNAGEKVNHPDETAIVLNTPFSIYRTVFRTTFKRQNFYSETALISIYTPIHHPEATLQFQKKNVVVLILESFSKEHSGYFNKQFNGIKYNGYMPFLDSLAQQSQTWVYSYANGVKSIDAIPSVLGSVPSLVQPFALSKYSLNKMNGLAAVLKQEGYYTAFFHGAPNGSMGFDSITRMLGFEHYVGKNEYGNDADFDGYWGIRDEEFLQFFANSMDKMPQPFMTSIFTLSSHHPYKISARYESVFKGGTMPIHRTVQYADYALKRFFQTASKKPWFKNTLFVISADHSLPSSEHAEYKSTMGVFSIPIIFYQSGSNLHQIDSTQLIQQIDVMPSVLGYLHYNKPYFAFGKDHFNPTEQPQFIANYTNGVYQYMEREWTIHSDGKKLLAVYNHKKDKLLTSNLVKQNLPQAATVYAHFKAFLQQYNNRMIDNRLTISAK